jgi:hypothetical protein
MDGLGEHIQPIDAGIVLVFPQNQLPDFHIQSFMIFSQYFFYEFIDISLGNHAGIIETFQNSELQTGDREGLFAYFYRFSQFPEESEEIIRLVLRIGLKNYLFIEHHHFRSLFIMVHYRQFIRDIIGS